METNILKEELENSCSLEFIPWEALKNRNILITGSTGLIGSSLVRVLLLANREKKLNLRVFALIRNEEKAKKLFANFTEDNQDLIFVKGDVQDLPDIQENIHYIVHGANPTSSKYFVEYPVETIQTAVHGTENILELGKKKDIEGFVFLSTMEVYGYPEKGHKVSENDIGAFQTMNARNCYPLSKQLCENLCCAYAGEYGMPAKVLRLTQTFGPGVDYNDGRVFAEFARCAIEKRNIVLKTKGKTERSYLYTFDAISAILSVLVNGKAGQAYTAANETTYCTIYDMAQLVANEFGINVIIEEQDVTKLGYANELHMDLDTTKLQRLGWRAQVGLKEMYTKMIDGMKN